MRRLSGEAGGKLGKQPAVPTLGPHLRTTARQYNNLSRVLRDSLDDQHRHQRLPQNFPISLLGGEPMYFTLPLHKKLTTFNNI
ncbi:unnamed protein product [Spodoptera exigua]|nr:unnamed protein product [Spodoptera exigua]